MRKEISIVHFLLAILPPTVGLMIYDRTSKVDDFVIYIVQSCERNGLNSKLELPTGIQS